MSARYTGRERRKTHDPSSTNEHDVTVRKIEAIGQVGVQFSKALTMLFGGGSVALTAYFLKGKWTILDVRGVPPDVMGAAQPAWLQTLPWIVATVGMVLASAGFAFSLYQMRRRRSLEAQLQAVLDQRDMWLIEGASASLGGRAPGAARRVSETSKQNAPRGNQD